VFENYKTFIPLPSFLASALAVVSKREVDELIPNEDFGHAKSELIRNFYLTKKRHISSQLTRLSELLA